VKRRAQGLKLSRYLPARPAPDGRPADKDAKGGAPGDKGPEPAERHPGDAGGHDVGGGYPGS
jgi:hypothetical protein